MNTLTTEPLASVLDSLFENANDASQANDVVASFSDEELKRLMQSKTEYLDFYGHLKDMPIAVSRETGLLLYMLARSIRAKTIVEFGTSFGISTLHLAAALHDNDGGLLITSEFEPSKVTRARKNLSDGGVIDLVDLREGDAMQTLSVDLPETIDLVLLDGAKGLYLNILNQLEPRFRPGTLVVADDADCCPEYLSHVRSPGGGYLSAPLNDDVELSMRLG